MVNQPQTVNMQPDPATSVQPMKPQFDPAILQSLGNMAPPRDSVGVVKALLPLFQQHPDLIHYVTALMQHPQEFAAMHPELGPQPQSSMQPPMGGGQAPAPQSAPAAPASPAAPAAPAAPAKPAAMPASPMSKAATAALAQPPAMPKKAGSHFGAF